MDDPVLPEIGSVFILTKKDSTDFDRDGVSRRLGLIPTKTCPPTVSPGKLLSEIDPAEFQREYFGLTVLPAAAPPYAKSRMLSGVWSCPACTAGTLQPRCIGWRSF